MKAEVGRRPKSDAGRRISAFRISAFCFLLFLNDFLSDFGFGGFY